MSIHSSLRQLGGKGGTYRSVLKRFERLQHLLAQGPWSDARSIFGLPKTKQERIKIRKVATAEAAKAADTQAGESTATTPTTAKPSQSGQAPATGR